MNTGIIFALLGALVTLVLIAYLLGRKRKEDKQDVFWCQTGILGCYAAEALQYSKEQEKDFENSVFLAYHSQRIVESYKEKFSAEKFSGIEEYTFNEFNAKTPAEHIELARGLVTLLRKNGFEYFTSAW